MNKAKKGRKFSRKKDQRRALIKSLLGALFMKEKMKTTGAKAKEISRLADGFITKAKKGGDLAVLRILSEFLGKKIALKLIKEIGPRYKERKGGYTRTVKLGKRKSDGAEISQIELIK
jgi:large subunit ribosomal protein L17